MKQKTLVWILRWGVMASWFSFFLVTKTLYFPYVTGKQLYFNVLMEILLAVWLYLVFKYPSVQPKRSLITISLIVWLAVLLASSLLGVDFNLSFWGDAERMLGWFSLIHYFILYLIIITVFRTKQAWYWLLNSSIAVAVALALYSLFTNHGTQWQGSVNLASNISTLGNATYVAGVMLFNIYFALYFLLTKRDWRLKFLYLAALIIILAEFFYADVSGSQAGLAVSLMLFGGCYGWLHKNKKIKWGSLAAVAGLALILTMLFIFRNAPLFDNNKFGIILRGFSANNTSLNARFYAWRSGWEGFKTKPILGYGWGNFSVPFDEFFKAGLYHWTPDEEYYDRAHNMIVEMLAVAGILGLLSYLAIFVAVIIVLIRARKRGKIKPLAIASVVAIFASYFVHNLAVFDALPNFVCLMVALAWVYWLSQQPESLATDSKVDSEAIDDRLPLFKKITLILMWGLLALIIYYGNVRVIQMFRDAMRGTTAWYQGQIGEFKTYYYKTFSYGTPLDRDVRNLYIGFFVSNPYGLSGFTQQDLQDTLNFAMELDAKNVALSPLDHFAWLKRAQLFSMVGRISGSQELISQALEASQKATERGGEHLIPYLLRSNIYEAQRKPKEAVATVKEALRIYPNYYKALCPLIILETKYKLSVSREEVWKELDLCVDKGDIEDLVRSGYLKEAIKHYQDAKDQVRLERLQVFVPAQ